MNRLRIFWLFVVLLSFGNANATHNRAGEITYRHLGGFQYEATIITYTKADSPADRNALGISWGDGTIDTIPRINGSGNGEIVAPDIKKNIYVGVHTYPAPAIYTLSFEDANRNGGVVNIPNSINIPFFVSTQLIINPFLGINNSVLLLNPPIDQACPGQIFIHNPGAYDPDGDSISYRLTQCLGEQGLNIPGFTQPIATNSFSLNPVTGDLIWDTPNNGSIGEYNVAFIVEEWRNGILIGFVIRDMQITVAPCTNQPPAFLDLPDLCVDAGTIIQFDVSATDPDFPSQQITVSATGGPFQFNPPSNAIFTAQTGNGNVTQTFTWPTDCSHVKREPHLFSFRVVDNGNPNLSDYETVQIKVVAQAPAPLLVSPQNNGIQLNWSFSPCPQALGYAIYRKNGSSGFIPNSCETGVPVYTGYVLIDTILGISTLSYFDNNNGQGLLPGNSYCYMVTALFGDGAESYATNEACAELKNTLPIITNVSIRKTALENGSIFIAWSKPKDLDTLQTAGPFKYIIERKENNFYIAVDSLTSLNDTTYVDSSVSLNTLIQNYTYRIALKTLENNAFLRLGNSNESSSVYLNAIGISNGVDLSWTFSVPWQNDSFIIYRQLNPNGNFDSIGTSIFNKFRDVNLANGIPVCYKVESRGRYSGSGTINPILNFSQESCATPIDKIPPCKPILSVQSSCDSLSNILNWNFPSDTCFNDIAIVNIYFTPSLTEPLKLISSVIGNSSFSYKHQPKLGVAGCYAITAIDSFLNESSFDSVCVDNCPIYELPNVFSPNGDGINDKFRPYPYKFIENISINIFNRWGKKVFATNDKDVNWSGADNETGILLTDGIYFYICTVNEQRLEGIVSRNIKGTVTIIDSKPSQNK
jgi:gliding motility-associated-like protein